MQIAFRILANTPVWVFALLAYLIWQGWQAMRPRTQPIWRMLIVPLVFLLMGLSRLVLARGNGLEPLLTWFVTAILFASLALFRGPQLLAVDKARGEVTRPGSAGPLIRNITVFSLQYAVAVASAMKLSPMPPWQSLATPSPAPVSATFRAGRRRCCAVTGISTAAKMPGEGLQTNPWLLRPNERTVAACES